MPIIQPKDAEDSRDLAARLLEAAGDDPGRVRTSTQGPTLAYDVDDDLAAAIGRAPDRTETETTGGADGGDGGGGDGSGGDGSGDAPGSGSTEEVTDDGQSGPPEEQTTSGPDVATDTGSETSTTGSSKSRKSSK